MADEKPIIVIKKKGGHGGHHGGAWKVAYADFVTAMMAFFMVMWLINSAETVTKKNIASYFRRPGLFEEGSGTPLLLGQAGILLDGGSPDNFSNKRNMSGELQAPEKKRAGAEEDPAERIFESPSGEKAKGVMKGEDETFGFLEKEDKRQRVKFRNKDRDEQLEALTRQMEKKIQGIAGLKNLLGIVDVKLEADGINIEVIDTENSSMFSSGSARILPEAEAAFTKIGDLIKALPYQVDIVGHTDAKPFSSRNLGYSNWELSSDRANAARRLLEKIGISPDRFTSVLGKADREPRIKDDPLNAANRRITLKLKIPPDAELPQDQLPEELNQLNFDEDENDKVHALTPKEILEMKRDEPKTIELPNEPSPPQNPTFIEKDKIFGDTPVIGPPQFFWKGP